MAANNVLYDVTILSIRPAGTPKSLSLLNDWITATKGRGEFLACWYTEMGAPARCGDVGPQAILDAARRPEKEAGEKNLGPPPGRPARLVAQQTDIYLPAAFSPLR